ncbi:PadR family transcriptional regulator [Aneurinibacillus sp. REN35]|uniref:PadR family transcriptional regulator n=1 Tax=Aneurinibacillus sp. REN35 TaxID=3237286 RepID=UPI003527938A
MREHYIHSDLIRGNIDTIILGIILREDNYGYSIIKEIFRKSGETFELKEPTLYSSLRRLESQRLVESYWGEQTQGGRRKYYRITESGREVYIQNLQNWEAARNLIDRLIVSDNKGKEDLS